MPNVPVTKYSSNEPYVSIHISNAMNILVTNNPSGFNQSLGANMSNDGGKTFLQFTLPFPPGFNSAADPTSDSYIPNIFLASGIIFTIKCGVDQGNRSVAVWKSTNFGMQFGPPVITARSDPGIFEYDKPVLHIDNFANSPFKGNAYIAVQRRAVRLNCVSKINRYRNDMGC